MLQYQRRCAVYSILSRERLLIEICTWNMSFIMFINAMFWHKWIAWSAKHFIHCSNYSIFTRTPTIFSTFNPLNMINYQSIEKYYENALFCKLPSHFLVNQISIVMPGFQGLEWWNWIFCGKIVFMWIYLMIQDILSVILV